MAREGGAGLAAQIREAEDRLAFLKTRSGAASCVELGEHDWRLLGGCNAGCCETCGCSALVYECARCKACDYGDNAEAAETRKECADDVRREHEAEDRARDIARRARLAPDAPAAPDGRA